MIGPMTPAAAITPAEKPGSKPRRFMMGIMVELIAATTTQAGLWVACRLDERTYAKGRRISDTQMAEVNLVPEAFPGEWNYTIPPTNL